MSTKSAKFKFSVLVLLFLVILLPSAAAASVKVIVDFADEKVNAIEGSISLPLGAEIDDLSTGESSIVLWIEAPHYSSLDRTIRFAGITPGGIEGKQTLFSIMGSIPNLIINGSPAVDITALSADGSGREVPISVEFREGMETRDDESPEEFVLELVSLDPYKKYILSFIAQDKGSGIDHYEFAGKMIGSPNSSDWEPISSPYLVDNALLHKKIYVKAVDRMGNERIASVRGPYHHPSIAITFVVLLSICGAYILRKKLAS